MDLGLRRILLLIISVAGGIGLTFGLLALINVAYNANVTYARYGTVYFVATAVPFALLVAVWLDVFMNTQLLPTVVEDESAAAAEEAAE